MHFYSWLAVGVGGFLGSLLRVAVGSWLNTSVFGTLFCNVLGCFLYGFFDAGFTSGYFYPRLNSDLLAAARLVVLGGFIGALTTFSTLVYEFHGLSSKDSIWQGSVYLVASLLLGLWAMSLGKYVMMKF